MTITDSLHSLAYTVNNHAQATNGQYSGFINVADKSKPIHIIADRYAPTYKVSAGLVPNWPPDGKLPDLQRWSDLFALLWFHESGGAADGAGTVPGPRWIVTAQIIEGKTDTQEAIRYAHSITGKMLSEWPGNDFDPIHTPEAFYGLLGTAHGQGPGFVLTQHKNWFGQLKIDMIKSWVMNIDNPNPKIAKFYALAFSIVPVQAPVPNPQGTATTTVNGPTPTSSAG